MTKTEGKKREQLIEFLDEKLFDPILRASPDDYESQDSRKKLHDVKKHIEKEKLRFRDRDAYPAAADIKKSILLDLQSKTGEKMGHDLDQLDLPRLTGIKDEFLKLCDALKV
ncbi:MAG: hypothetical protein M0Z58_01050 [Nitrospiraceae bacterium]|nr:hypothetical protein [Nitrospiraceae bacterium]